MKISSILSIAALASVISAAPTVTAPPNADATDGTNWSTYPAVPKTASINGFADKIYDQLPECAKPCMNQDTGSTPCPYWDTGCLCVMPQFAGPIGNCIANNCKGTPVQTATSLASSICSSAGVWSPYWMIPATVKTKLDSAAAVTTAA